MAAPPDPKGEWTTEEIMLAEVSDLNKRKTQLKAEYSSYIAKHRQVKEITNAFMTAALLEKPDNVFEFARKHFAGLQAEFCPQDAGTLVPLVLTGPPGVGKKTLAARLQQACPHQFVDPLKHTTRKPVADFETDGEDAHFMSLERLELDIENGRLFWWGEDSQGHLEGLSFAAVDAVVASGKVPVVCVPVDAFKALLKSRRFAALWTCCVRPHDTHSLLERLEAKGLSPHAVTAKLAQADKEMDWIHAQQEQGRFDKVVVDAVLEVALAEMKEAVVNWYPHVERHMVKFAPR